MSRTNNIRVLIVDDDAAFRMIWDRSLKEIPGVVVVGKASNGAMALRSLEKEEVDLVLLDVYMPEMNGLEALEEISKKHPNCDVVMVSGASGEQASLTIKSLEKGALDFIPKPQEDSIAKNKETLVQELMRIVALVHTRRKGPTTSIPRASTSTRIAQSSIPARNRKEPGKCNLIAIGSSTGGPQALRKLLPELPGDLGCPVLIVQHMPEKFTLSLAKSLDSESKIEIREAVHNELVLKNQVLIAPGGKHMEVSVDPSDRKMYINISEGPQVNSCRPAVDVLFRSLSKIPSLNILSVILTGMGRDGVAGIASMKINRCYSIVQSEESCVVYGMPRMVIEEGLADEIIDLDLIPQRISNIMKGDLCKV